ncbi:2-acyl-1-lysophosphatidylinositol acyltransferase [[Candida] railenensis]|uniref:2-acyl-1-lysophosphatidylinositol acyltransferase n=1 Tax=[Candida] railenensis TaxID=45579 RepID=A0A9P0QL29_9ASCO|nr:2-acyl-1-lysophosphatidylinositol acyltransferase [[Candida] railenensis]
MLSRHSYFVSAVRTAIIFPIFILGCTSIVFTQEVAKLVFANSPANLQAVINLTKKHFIDLFTFVTSIISPSKLVITYDPATVDKNLSLSSNGGHLSSVISPNSIVISNHQIYTDWLSLWHILSTANGGSVYIFLKDLSWIPILGRGMKNYNFLFLSRKWEKDKVLLTNQLLEIDANARGFGPANGVTQVFSTTKSTLPIKHWPQGEAKDSTQMWPYQIILYPEGTVTSPHTRIRSEKYCKEKGLPVLKHVLLPRVRGLFITLKKLKSTVEVVYDITTGYSGLKTGENGEDIYTLKKFLFLGYGPKTIHHHIKSYRLEDIPLGSGDEEDIDSVKEEDLKRFEQWLFEVWFEKDRVMDEFYQNGTFENLQKYPNLKTVHADIKVRSYYDVLNIYLPLFIVLLILRNVCIAVYNLF